MSRNLQRRLLLAVGVAGLTAATILAGASGQRPKGTLGPTAQADGLKRLLALSPAERAKWLSKLDAKDRDSVTLARGAVVATLIERGQLAAVQTSDIVCRVKPTAKARPAVIKWVIDDGTPVKKGEKLIEFDSAALADQARAQKDSAAQAEANLKRAAQDLTRMRQENQNDIKLAQIDVQLAGLTLRQYKGNDPLQKEVLTLHVEKALVLLDRVRLKAAPKETQAEADQQTKKAVHEQEFARLRDLEAEIAKCVVIAPHDGFVVYHIPTGPFARAEILAVGEPVREGQKLLIVANLGRMAVQARVHEAQISRVRVGQTAAVRVDAFPARIFTGKVREVATRADATEFFRKDVKVYPVTVHIDGDNLNLHPGMSGEVTITTGARPDCLRLPTSAIVTTGKDKICFVLADEELQVRKLIVGLTGDTFVEITNGLNAGDQVLRNPRALTSRLAEALPKDSTPSQK